MPRKWPVNPTMALRLAVPFRLEPRNVLSRLPPLVALGPAVFTFNSFITMGNSPGSTDRTTVVPILAPRVIDRTTLRRTRGGTVDRSTVRSFDLVSPFRTSLSRLVLFKVVVRLPRIGRRVSFRVPSTVNTRAPLTFRSPVSLRRELIIESSRLMSFPRPGPPTESRMLKNRDTLADFQGRGKPVNLGNIPRHGSGQGRCIRRDCTSTS